MVIASIDDITRLFKDYCGLVGIPQDAVPLWEPYLTAPVEKRIGQARVEGKIKNSDDFLRIYKDSVKAEVDTLREKTLKYRAQGQQNATTRINDVRNASTLQPQAVTSTPSEQTSEAPIETVDSYIARRQAASQKAHGMV